MPGGMCPLDVIDVMDGCNVLIVYTAQKFAAHGGACEVEGACFFVEAAPLGVTS